MFRIKICGITTRDDAQAAAEAGADAVGLNFFARSPRFLSPDRAGQIVEALPAGVVKVGLFVNATAEHVRTTVERLGLDLVQFHGDEPPEFLLHFADMTATPVMKAFRVGPDGIAPVEAYLDRCRELGSMPRLVLLDAQVAGHYGGTGVTTDWSAAARFAATAGHPPLVLAGGLNAGNVAAAIAAVRPAAVDTASGVETAPGRKDPAAVRAFVASARSAFEALQK